MGELTVSQISKQYGSHIALSPISIEANRGEIIALCGGNGAGKSTLIKILAGLFPPSSGAVEYNGVSLSSKREQYAHKIGYMPDDFQFPSMLSVKEWLSFFASLRHISTDYVMKRLNMVGLVEKQNAKCTSLSKGMRQRLLFAQACLADPDILLLDEPTNGLDPFWTASFATMLKQIRKEQKIVIYSTHQINLAVELADVIIFMHEGKVLQRWNRKECDQDSILKELNVLVQRNLGSDTNKENLAGAKPWRR